ncbi:MAG: ATP-dependent zinc metalloprotease FtsH [Planctomycetes bacterium]|nr:ATP-dependent zinc metalloprotease FtsH [Planctomycetota bacterium]
MFTLIYVALAFALLLALNTYLVGPQRAVYAISYTTFADQLQAGNVATLVVTPTEVEGTLREPRDLPVAGAPEQIRSVERFTSARLPGDDQALVRALEAVPADARPVVTGRQDSRLGSLLLWILLPGLVLILGLFFIMRLLSPNRQVMSFGKSRARVYAEKETKITLDDVAGIEEAKEELREIVEFLRDPQPYHKLGARIPRGILLVGPPGTGKTLLARAVAGEASVVFFSLSGSDFVEMFAGVGASRVRDLFEQAQRQAPCIVFIDELDALGKVRGVGVSGAHDEREQTLNQLLSEMDGFDPNMGVVILAATNRPEILDPALLRPGRFDRQVVVDRPDVKGREQILRIHAKKVRLADDVDLAKLARQTPGLVGADLANVVNEAALLAGRRRKEAVEQVELEEAIQRSLVGLERKSRIMGAPEKERIAVHETGHALVALAVPHADPVSRVSIIARGVGALGYTMQTPAEDRHLYTRGELDDRLAVLLGGRGAELIIYGDTSTGASDDLARAADLARRMVLEFGMSERMGPVSLGSTTRRQRFLNVDGDGAREYSDATAREVDEEVRRIVREVEARVGDLLGGRERALRAIASHLVQKEVILAEELVDLARKNGAPPAERPATVLQVTPAAAAPPLAPAEPAVPPEDAA